MNISNYRIEEGAQRAIINRELSALKRVFSLASQSTPPKVAQKPYIPMLKENNTRKGFFEHKDFLNLLTALHSYLNPVISFAYRTGWRKSEILGLTWDRVDLREESVRLDAGDAKNNVGSPMFSIGTGSKSAVLGSLGRQPLKRQNWGIVYSMTSGGRLSGI